MANTGLIKDGKFKYNGTSWEFYYNKLMPDSRTINTRATSKTLEEAKEKYISLNREYEDACRKAGISPPSICTRKMKALDYFQYYLEENLSLRAENTTIMVYKYSLYKHIAPIIRGDIELRDLDEKILNQLLDELTKTSKVTANKAREFLYLAFKEAKAEGLIANIPRMKKCPRPPRQVRLFTKEEFKLFLKVASDNDWYLEVLLCVFCGLRKGELLGLKFADFDKEAQAVYIRRQLSYQYVLFDGTCEKKESYKMEKPPKTDNSIRPIYVPKIIWEELEKRSEKVEKDKSKYKEEYQDNDYVSCTDVGEARGTSSFNAALTKMCARNGLRHYTVHMLRYTYATIILEQCGYELALASALLGHSSINTTFEFYASIMDGSEEINKVLNELYPVPEVKEDA